MKRLVVALVVLGLVSVGGLAMVVTVAGAGVAAGAGTGGVLTDADIPPEMARLYEAAAAQYGLPAAFLAAIGKVETDHCRTVLVSSAGALGCMQLLPATFAGFGYDANGDGSADPMDAADSVFSAARFIAEALMAPLGGDLRPLAAAYNAGLGAVQRYGGVPPYAETQRYVLAVLHYAGQYAMSSMPGAGAPSPGAAAAVAFAYSAIGLPYQWGGSGPNAYDCSGLTQAAWAAGGVALPRVANDQYLAGIHPDPSALAPGDLLFWATNLADERSIHHVALYVGGGKMTEAPHTGALVRLADVYWDGFYGATRPA